MLDVSWLLSTTRPQVHDSHTPPSLTTHTLTPSHPHTLISLLTYTHTHTLTPSQTHPSHPHTLISFLTHTHTHTDLPLQLNHAKYEFNGATGYVLKPWVMLTEKVRGGAFNPFTQSKMEDIVPAKLSIKVSPEN